MTGDLLRFDGVVEHDPAIAIWFQAHPGELGTIANKWFSVMRDCGDEIRELLHDGCPTVCFGDVAFASVNIFTSHVNVGFFLGSELPDPDRLLQGTGKRMRHVKLRPGENPRDASLTRLIETAYERVKTKVENG